MKISYREKHFCQRFLLSEQIYILIFRRFNNVLPNDIRSNVPDVPNNVPNKICCNSLEN